MSKLLEIIPRWAWLMLVACLAFACWRLDARGDAAQLELERTRVTLADTKAQHAGERESAARRLVRIVDSFREAESHLAAMAAATKKAADDEVHTARADARSLRQRLLAAETALKHATAGGSAETPGATGNGAFARGSVGALIPGQAVELVGEAERAERIRIALMGCYRQYDEARDTLLHLNLKN